MRRIRFWKVECEDDSSRLARSGAACAQEDGKATDEEGDAGSVERSENSLPRRPTGPWRDALPLPNLTEQRHRCKHNITYFKRAEERGWYLSQASHS
jgi:hypothetical protein